MRRKWGRLCHQLCGFQVTLGSRHQGSTRLFIRVQSVPVVSGHPRHASARKPSTMNSSRLWCLTMWGVPVEGLASTHSLGNDMKVKVGDVLEFGPIGDDAVVPNPSVGHLLSS